MFVQKCPRCGQYKELSAKPQMWIQRQVNGYMIHTLKLCADCEQKLIRFMKGGLYDEPNG